MQCSSCQTCKLGYLGYHIPLLTSSLKIHIQCSHSQLPKFSPQIVLNHPVANSDWLTFMQSLQDPAYGVVQELQGILKALNPSQAKANAFLSDLR